MAEKKVKKDSSGDTGGRFLIGIPKEVIELQLALGMSGIGISHQTCEIILEVQKLIKEKGGKARLSDAIDCRLKVEKIYNPYQK